MRGDESETVARKTNATEENANSESSGGSAGNNVNSNDRSFHNGQSGAS